jgi:hypothetical protein
MYETLLEAVIESGPYATNAILLIATTALKVMPSLKCGIANTFQRLGKKKLLQSL